ncbi:MAG TPA: 1-deoxy-D-xylulose-5-phosphate synthase [bacterium]|nr:1-deoxy-D-xylulose-5-phosphate synthase [bacterium]HPP29863.1 1-deoxy-D-xylulose-5-phosphate synthase [bacterium]
MELIEKVSQQPAILKELSVKELETLASEIRQIIIETVSKKGGHLSSNLGVVELTLAIHRVFNIPPDKVIWDVGHQCYTHKLLTGRYKNFSSLRTYKGLTGYPSPEEDVRDIFKTGHAGTAVSSATGLKTGQDFLKDKGKVIAIIGDGSLTNGLTFEGLNFLGALGKELLIILNDNRMSISPTKGALSYYLTKLITSPFLNKPKEEFMEVLKKIPGMGENILHLAKDLEKKAKYLIVPGVFFEKLGLRYLGPIDGHNIQEMIDILTNIKEIKEPVLLHIITRKGKGYRFAEERPDDFHGTGPFDIKTGAPVNNEAGQSAGCFAGKILEKLGEKDTRIVVLTAAMEKGLGLEDFARRFPDRFFDVGIAEGHCITFASGLSKAGMKVFVAMYSTFLQRCYDQIFHDICLQKLPVVFLIDRAGIVGEDGPTHHGIFDISFLRTLPDLKIFTPYSMENLEYTIMKTLEENTPCFIRYPKGKLPEKLEPINSPEKKLAILACGSMADYSIKACDILKKENINVSCLPVDKVKPLDEILLKEINSFERIVTVEENTASGGFGSAVLEYLGGRKEVLRIGLPEAFIEQGKREFLLEKYGMSPAGIAERIKKFLKGQGND